MSSDSEREIKKSTKCNKDNQDIERLEDELLRRALVAKVKEIGTTIRLKEIERQRITVRINQPKVMQLIDDISRILNIYTDIANKFIQITIDSLSNYIKEIFLNVNIMSEDWEKSLNTLSQNYQTIFTKVIISLNIFNKIIGYDLYETPKTLLSEVNEQIKITNKILEELKKEGISISSSFTEFPIKDNITENYYNLSRAQTILKIIKGIYEEILEITKNKTSF
jgi:hypothetical protein